MNEEIFMNRKAIEVVLLAVDKETDILRFKFEDTPLDVNLNSPLCQNELKAVFVRLLQMIIENDVYLEFNHEKDYGRGLYIEVCEEYVRDLNRELESAKEKIHKEIGQQNDNNSNGSHCFIDNWSNQNNRNITSYKT